MPENNMKIIIREMQPEDVSAVAALEAECFRNHGVNRPFWML